jgi:hypothetical protein
MKKFQVIFYGDGENIPYTEEYFNSKIEAEKWAEGQEWSESDTRYNSEGHEEFYIRYQFHNPEDKSNYSNYEIEPIEIKDLNEEFLHMQKLAGLITESEYNKKIREINLIDISDKILKKWDVIKQHIKNQGYDI